MWQRVWPNTFVVAGALTQDNFQWNAGDVKNELTPLKPFTKDASGNFWTPDDVRTQVPFHYYYPETSGAGTASSVMATVNRLYGPSSPTNSKKRDFRLGARGDYEGQPLQKGDKDYTCHVVTDKFGVGGSYSVEMWLSESGCDNILDNILNGTSSLLNSTLGFNFTSGSYNYNTSTPTYVGLYGVLAPYAKQDQITYVSGTVPLTTVLQGKYHSGELSSLDEAVVEAYLAKHLCWKVKKSGGDVIPPETVPSLGVAVTSQEVTCAAGEDTFPTYGSTNLLPGATKGKPAGYSSGSYGPPGVEVCTANVQYEYVDEQGNFLYSSMGSA
jgi:tyrosinase